MSQLSPEEIYQAIGKIVANFPLLECDKCAIAVMQWVAENEIEGKIIRLKTKRRNEVFIASDRWNPNESITENGTHYGVEVLGRVFDNLSTEGMAREDWLRDFHCPSEKFIVEELESL
ncbi:MAG: papain fold toxin domain-containing protein [Heteroscytonema crispum UTEX LB 1556]